MLKIVVIELLNNNCENTFTQINSQFGLVKYYCN